jgi:hypothetical protein
VVKARERLLEIQREYFDILESNSIIRNCLVQGEDYVGLPRHLLEANGQLVIRAGRRWKTATLYSAEDLMDRALSFWSKRYKEVYDLIGALESRFIHVDFHRVDTSVRKYGTFFDGVLVSDQLLMTKREYELQNHVSQWQNLVATVAKDVVFWVRHKDDIFLNPSPPLVLVVPPRQFFYSEEVSTIFNESMSLAIEFVSELLNRSFADIDDYGDYRRKNRLKATDLNPKMLQLAFSRYGAKSIQQYNKAVAETLLRDTGSTLLYRDDFYRIVAYDIGARFSEFERFATDAYMWSQEPALPILDLDLYEWWFDKSARRAAKAMGSSYSGDFICKLAPLSCELSFLNNISIHDLYTYYKSSSVEELRHDLHLERLKLRRSKRQSLASTVEIVGQHITERLNEFEASTDAIRKEYSNRAKDEGLKVGASTALTIASMAFPPLSAVSLLWGGSASSLYSAAADKRKALEKRLSRPIASLVEWRSRAART